MKRVVVLSLLAFATPVVFGGYGKPANSVVQAAKQTANNAMSTAREERDSKIAEAKKLEDKDARQKAIQAARDEANATIEKARKERDQKIAEAKK